MLIIGPCIQYFHNSLATEKECSKGESKISFSGESHARRRSLFIQDFSPFFKKKGKERSIVCIQIKDGGFFLCDGKKC